ncbi:MAG: C69 family dipeptidase [Leptospiraceae bacterium]|nr:C69 family dipeptidase [Leptospiraceae bacterium]
MADIILATQKLTKNRAKLVFGKNSNREPNEPQVLVRIPKKKNKDKFLTLSYIEIPQSKLSHELILSKSSHLWGAETGVNEFGLTIAITKAYCKAAKSFKENGFTGPELVRLALERCKTADQALEFITNSIQDFGQSSDSGCIKMENYHFSNFVIADSNKAFYLETFSTHWVALKVHGFFSASDGYTIEDKFDYSSKGIKDFAVNNHYLQSGNHFSFRNAFGDKIQYRLMQTKVRKASSNTMGEIYCQTEGLGIKEVMDILRSHKTSSYSPQNGDMGSICLHASGILTPFQTTNSIVIEIKENSKVTTWSTLSSSPCLSLYKPFYFGTEIISEDKVSEKSSQETFWWKFEEFHRLAIQDYEYAKHLVLKEKQESERHWRRKDKEFQNAKTSTKQLQEFSTYAVQHHKEILKIWIRDLKSRNKSNLFSPLYNMFWSARNKEANLNQ